jgi:hypothetical protein
MSAANKGKPDRGRERTLCIPKGNWGLHPTLVGGEEE